MGDILEVAAPLVTLAAMSLGVLLLWIASASREWRRTEAEGLTLLLLIFGWFSLSVGLAVALGSLVFAVTMPLVIPVIISLLLAFSWHARSKRSLLLWTVAHAAQKGIPIPEALHALASERSDSISRRAGLLAVRLERGEPLSSAISSEVGFASLDSRLALGMGESLGLLGPALESGSQRGDDFEHVRAHMIEGVLYVVGLMLIGGGVVTFMAWRILPVVLDMLQEFEIQPAPMTELAVVMFPYLGQIALPTGILLAFIFLFVLLRHLNWLPADLPLLSLIGKPLHRARILDALALAINHGRTIQDGLRVLMVEYPISAWRNRLGRAMEAIEQGQPWIESLARVGVVKPAGKAVLSSAERAGNLPWALSELARIYRRRYVAKTQVYYRLIGSSVILLFGALFLFMSALVFVPLVQLIGGLAR